MWLLKLIASLFQSGPAPPSEAEQKESERLHRAESEFNEKFRFCSDLADWQRMKGEFPRCPKCHSNEAARLMSFGLRRDRPEDWEHQFLSFGGCLVPRTPERWYCANCYVKFLGHQSD